MSEWRIDIKRETVLSISDKRIIGLYCDEQYNQAWTRTCVLIRMKLCQVKEGNCCLNRMNLLKLTFVGMILIGLK